MKRFNNIEFNKNLDFRLATEYDFRTNQNTLLLDLEYYEYMIGLNEWELQVTDEFTDRTWLKNKIAFGFIKVPVIPSYWNQKSKKEPLAKTG